MTPHPAQTPVDLQKAKKKANKYRQCSPKTMDPGLPLFSYSGRPGRYLGHFGGPCKVPLHTGREPHVSHAQNSFQGNSSGILGSLLEGH